MRDSNKQRDIVIQSWGYKNMDDWFILDSSYGIDVPHIWKCAEQQISSNRYLESVGSWYDASQTRLPSSEHNHMTWVGCL